MCWLAAKPTSQLTFITHIPQFITKSQDVFFHTCATEISPFKNNWIQFILNPNLGGLFRGSFRDVGGEIILPCLKHLRIMVKA